MRCWKLRATQHQRRTSWLDGTQISSATDQFVSSTAVINHDQVDPFRGGPQIPGSTSFRGTDWALLGAIVVFAALLRMVFFTGYFGSDEVTYVEAAIAAANGVWPNSLYIGAIRLGVNYPIAIAIALFGVSEAAVSMWGFLCSVLEVGVVYWWGANRPSHGDRELRDHPARRECRWRLPCGRRDLHRHGRDCAGPHSNRGALGRGRWCGRH